MNNLTNSFVNISLSLADILGEKYITSVCQAKSFLEGKSVDTYLAAAHEKVDFFPGEHQERLIGLIPSIGKKVIDRPFEEDQQGSSTASFNAVFSASQSPLSGTGYYKVTEDGTLRAITKSEHYHAPLGHDFPGYRLIENAKTLGISNVTHNNTRGFITRLLEEDLIQIANGTYETENESALTADSLSKIINLQTGSLAVEAGLKMMLARFYTSDPGMSTEPEYKGKVPVFIVMEDLNGGRQANYHGTTILTQTMRELWPDLYNKFVKADAYVIKSTPINDIDTFKKIVEENDSGKYKVAGFFHEIVLMNYGGIKLDKEYLQQAHSICKERDIPTLVDEIQSCLWAPDFFLYKEYGLKPDFVSVGKGFPGGQYAASKILLTEKMDNLNQFGALVTNGQEELASLAYLITILFAHANKEVTRELGDYFELSLNRMADKYPLIIKEIEGMRHLSSIVFESAEIAAEFAEKVRNRGYDISAQTYKANCPPAALTKIPLIADSSLIDAFIACMEDVLKTY
ncbi:MAG: aminotransferase class III-fold pyridoxal phosphate-dependent enzyme [Bacteroidetes bacterium]|nr:aminotransferase class III-fold pyridoxal phosphate-dependent enzyme [Bacteroidota bacterium]